MLALISDEAAQARDQARESLEALSHQLELANRAASRFRVSLPNRDEAITELNRKASGAESEARPYVGIFVADVLSALRLRHGNEVSEHLLDEVSRKGILPLVPGGKIFRWSAQSVVAIWSSTKKFAEISTEIASSCQAPFNCRAFVGTRTATFHITMRFVVLDAYRNTAELVRTLDGLAKGADPR
jgi:hypothetical protein